jgi:hypothetical protein
VDRKDLTSEALTDRRLAASGLSSALRGQKAQQLQDRVEAIRDNIGALADELEARGRRARLSLVIVAVVAAGLLIGRVIGPRLGRRRRQLTRSGAQGAL